jgi:hypothetical protein
MPILDMAALNAVTKIQYTQDKVNDLVYPESLLFAKMRKKTNFYGDSKRVAFQFGNPQGRAANFAAAAANVTPSAYAGCLVTRARDYVVCELSGEAIEASGEDAGALLRGLKGEIDSGFYTSGRSIANSLFQNGGGSRGRFTATQALGSAVITLLDPNSVVHFERNQILNLGATDGTSGIKKAGSLTVASVDRDLGTITLTGTISAGVPTAAVSDFIFQAGDFEGVRTLPTGLPGWIPRVAPTTGDNFFGMDRSVDPVRLAGLRYTAATGGPIEETLTLCAARLAREGAMPDVAVINPIDYGNMVVSMGNKVVYSRLGSDKDPEFGFDSVRLIGPRGPISVIPDLNCPTGEGWMLTMKSWSFETLNKGPRILNLDGNEMRANALGDSYILRIGYYGNFICEAPGWNAYFKL